MNLRSQLPFVALALVGSLLSCKQDLALDDVLFACETHQECRDGWYCVPLDGQAELKVCRPGESLDGDLSPDDEPEHDETDGSDDLPEGDDELAEQSDDDIDDHADIDVQSCASAVDCGALPNGTTAGRICAKGLCAACTIDTDCRQAPNDYGALARCFAGVCHASCNSGSDCPSGHCSAGLCTQCSGDDDCPDAYCSGGSCVATCANDDDCDGYCVDHRCVQCIDDANEDCGLDAHCDPATLTCVVGECSTDTDCASPGDCSISLCSRAGLSSTCSVYQRCGSLLTCSPSPLMCSSSASIQSATSSGGLARQPALSASGRYVAFSATGTINETFYGPAHVFLRDLWGGPESVQCLSCPNGEPAASGASTEPSISDDGCIVAFASTAAILDDEPSTHDAAIYVWSCRSNSLRRLAPRSGVPTSPSSAPVLSGDGRTVAFVSAATQWSLRPISSLGDVFRFDLATGRIDQISIGRVGAGAYEAANGRSSVPSLSRHGTRIAFESTSTNLTGEALTPGYSRVLYLDCDLGNDCQSSTPVVVEAGSAPINGSASAPSISSDGSTVAFTSGATNLIAGEYPSSISRVFTANLDSGLIRLVSRGLSEPWAGEGSAPRISDDGQSVVLASFSSLSSDDSDGVLDVYHARFLDASDTVPRLTRINGEFNVELSASLSRDGLTAAITATEPDAGLYLIGLSQAP